MKPLRAVVSALACLYLINAAMTAGLALRYAEIVTRIGVTPAVFGVLLLGELVSLATVILTIAPRLVDRYGTKHAARWAGVAYCVSTALVGLLPSAAWFAAALVVRGAVNAVLDIAVTRATSSAERTHGRTLFTFLDIPAAVGLLLAATAGALASGRLPVPVFGAILGGAGLLVLAAAWRHVPVAVQADNDRAGQGRPVHTAALALLSATGLWLLLAGQDWPTLVYKELGASPTAYGAGGVAFVVGVVLGLLVSGPLADRKGRPAVLRLAALLLVGGMGAVVLLPSHMAVTFALGIAGLGAGPIHALALSAAGAGSSRAFARVVACGYIGAALSKPAISGLSALTGLQAALGMTGVALGLLVLGLAHETRAMHQPDP